MRIWIVLGLLSVLSACAPGEVIMAPNELVQAKAYRHPGPSSISVITMVNNTSGSGGHSALLINGSQRVIFDPAGSFQHRIVPEQRDVLFGITPAVLQGYRSAHARAAYHVVTQTIEVTPAQAEQALRAAQAYGAVGQAFCTQATTGVLRQVSGFEDIKATFFPTNLMRQFDGRPGVVTDRYFEDDEGGIVEGVAKIQAQEL